MPDEKSLNPSTKVLRSPSGSKSKSYWSLYGNNYKGQKQPFGSECGYRYRDPAIMCNADPDKDRDIEIMSNTDPM